MREGRAIWAGAAILFAVGAALRLWQIATTPLWLDEAYSAYAAAHGFAFLWQVVPRYETHPPFYYSVMRLWALVFGDGLVSLRAIGEIAGLLTPFGLAVAAREAARWLGWDALRARRLMFVAFGLACVSIPLVEMSRQVRPYAPMALVYTLALAALLRIGRALAQGRPLPAQSFAAYLVLVELMLWLHDLGPLWAAALGLAMLAVASGQASRRDWAWIVGGHGAVGLLYVPCLLIVLDQAPTWIGSTWLRFSFESMLLHLGVLYAVPGWQAIAALVLASMSGIALWRVRAGGRRLLAVLLLLAVVPTLLSIALTVTITPVFITRTLTPVVPPTLLLLAFAPVAWPRPVNWIGIGAAVMLAANMIAVDVQERASGPPQDWYGAIDWLEGRFRPGDAILTYPNEGALPLARALDDRHIDWPIRPIPTAVPAFVEPGGRYPTGSRGVVSLPRARLEAIAAEPATRAVPTIWLLRLGPETYDPGDLFLKALHRDRVIVRRYEDGPIDIVGLRRRDLISPPAPDRNRR